MPSDGIAESELHGRLVKKRYKVYEGTAIKTALGKKNREKKGRTKNPSLMI